MIVRFTHLEEGGKIRISYKLYQPRAGQPLADKANVGSLSLLGLLGLLGDLSSVFCFLSSGWTEG